MATGQEVRLGRLGVTGSAYTVEDLGRGLIAIEYTTRGEPKFDQCIYLDAERATALRDWLNDWLPTQPLLRETPEPKEVE